MKKSFLFYTVSSILFYSSSSLSYTVHHGTSYNEYDGVSRANLQTTSEALYPPPPIGANSEKYPAPPITIDTSTFFNQSRNTNGYKTTYPAHSSFLPSAPSALTPPPPSSATTITTSPKKTESTTPPSTRTITPKVSSQNSEENNPSTKLTNENVASSSSKKPAPSQESKQTSKTEATEVAKSRRRSGVSSSSTDPYSEKTPANSAVSSQPKAIQSSPNLQPTSAQSESVQKVPANSEPTGPKVTRPTIKASPAPKEPNLSSISLRPAAGKPTSQEPSESVKQAPAQSSSPQKAPEKSELAQIEDISARVVAKNGETVTLHNKKIQDRWNAVHAEGNNSKIQMNKGNIDAGFIALSVSEGGEIDATDIMATAETAGLLNIEGTINLKDSSIHVTGGSEASGIIFRNNLYRAPQRRHPRNAARNATPVQEEVQKQDIAGKVNLENTNLFVDHGVGINLYGTNTNGVVSLKNSTIHADVLLKNIKNESAFTNTLTLIADKSSLEGHVRTSKDNRTVFNLKEATKWLLKPNKNAVNNDRISDDNTVSNDYGQFGLDKISFSNLSVLRLTDSAIMFDQPMEEQYQTLFIGPNLPQEDEKARPGVVYSATGVSEIYVNTQWNKHSPVTEQQTDRIVINGDVSGNTIVHINLQETDKKIMDDSAVWREQMASLPLATHGVSIIQVSGQANENSFTLAGNYMTIGGQPYKYVLASYKPGTSHESQNLFGKKNDFWDFRLQNAYIDKDKKVRALLPQVANYLTLPNTLFSSGFADINNQNTLLDAMQTTVFGAEDHQQNNLFFSSYSEKVTLSSNRGPLRYGYDADVNYGALQLGVVLAALKGKDISTHLGLLGTYGKLVFIPKEMQDSEKTTLDKWSLSAYSAIKHRNGLYLNTLLSYGRLKGNITTALVGNAAKLDGTEILNLSATLGQKLATDTKGLVFEPQAQLIYQNFMFDIFSDANGLKVDMGNPHQWLVRLGGRLTKTIMAVEENKAVSFYGKMNFIRTFGDGKTIKIADTFDLDPTGSSIEGGVGVNAYLSQKIVLNGDISYRQKLQKAGISGINFSGGIQYRF
ncbi:autotransporter outer membrane beta-barrel domain-containing protein [Bartonella gabonensis]|uniref:autotransporter outer membrane beta-barrel domain-containing protein n=1 Tax=Bartonella gabonensis TaxID=2699889 RepID=UPI0015898A7B|nr:autotransporter outer membrane beta-barrel domain-containing protein [Bartonella gabonensis]